MSIHWLATSRSFVVVIVLVYLQAACSARSTHLHESSTQAAQSGVDDFHNFGKKGSRALSTGTIMSPVIASPAEAALPPGGAPVGDGAPHHPTPADVGSIRNINAPKFLNADGVAKRFGFLGAEEMADAELGSPLRIYKVNLSQLQLSQQGVDVTKLNLEKLLAESDTKSMLFPILVKGQVRSSVIVAEDAKGKGWRRTLKGAEKFTRLIAQQHPSSSSFLVVISPLDLRFLGDWENGQLVLTTIDDYPRFRLKAGDQLRADEYFAKLPFDQTTKEVVEYLQTFQEKSKLIVPTTP